MNSTDDRECIAAFVSELASRTVFRVKHHATLRHLEAEGIEQELLAYDWEHSDNYGPSAEKIEAFAKHSAQRATAKLLRNANHLRSSAHFKPRTRVCRIYRT